MAVVLSIVLVVGVMVTVPRPIFLMLMEQPVRNWPFGARRRKRDRDGTRVVERDQSPSGRVAIRVQNRIGGAGLRVDHLRGGRTGETHARGEREGRGDDVLHGVPHDVNCVCP